MKKKLVFLLIVLALGVVCASNNNKPNEVKDDSTIAVNKEEVDIETEKVSNEEVVLENKDLDDKLIKDNIVIGIPYSEGKWQDRIEVPMNKDDSNMTAENFDGEDKQVPAQEKWEFQY